MINLIKKFVSDNTGILIRMDDIAENMNWRLMKKCELLFDKHNIKPVLGVISNNKDPDLQKHESNERFWDQIRAWKEKNGKSQCMVLPTFMIMKLLKKIILIMEVNQNFLAIVIKNSIRELIKV